jgi:16S rRNA (guanine527-N7)-methyltransferase
MNTLSGVAKRLNVSLTPAQIQAFETYRARLISERSRAALTSLKDLEAIERRHFGESLALLKALSEANAFVSPAIDIGTGAGFPGLPMKIARPELQITLLEATGKKAAFLEALVAELGLTGVTVLGARAEDAARDPAHRGAYKLALARAVAPLRVLLELALPFLEIGGLLAAQKGSAVDREVLEATHALDLIGGRVESVRRLHVPWPGVAPSLVLVRKTEETPERFPRRAGVPSKRPL